MICTKDIVRLEMDLDDAIATKQKNANTFILENGKQLLQCAREGDSRGVVELLGKGAPITTDWLGTSPLHLAVMNNHYETCEVLLRAGVSKDGRTKVDRTPLHFAAYDGYYHIAKLLLKHGADVDCRDMLQMTPLHWAVERGHKECVKVLLSSGAKSDAVSRFNKTPLSIALEMNWNEVIQMLQKSSLLEATQSLNAEYDEMKEAVHKLTNEFDHVPLKLSNDKSSDSAILNDLDTDIDNEKDVQNVFASILPQVDESPNEATLQLLKEHGIMMLPTDSTNTVNSAIQSGRKVVLSDAGKLVLKDVNFQKDPPKPIEIKRKPIILPSTKMKSTKIYTVTSSQFLAMTGGKPNILQKIPETLKTSPYVQLQKNINLSPVKISPYSPNIKIVNNSMPTVKAVPDNQEKNCNPLLNSPPVVTTIKKGDIVKINQLKNSRIIKYNNSATNLSKPVKIVIKKNNIAKQMSDLPESISKVMNCDTTGDKEISSEDIASVTPLENFTLNDRISLSNNNSHEIVRLKSELSLARIEIDYYKKRYEETLTELILYKNKNSHSLMELETNSID